MPCCFSSKQDFQKPKSSPPNKEPQQNLKQSQHPIVQDQDLQRNHIHQSKIKALNQPPPQHQHQPQQDLSLNLKKVQPIPQELISESQSEEKNKSSQAQSISNNQVNPQSVKQQDKKKKVISAQTNNKQTQQQKQSIIKIQNQPLQEQKPDYQMQKQNYYKDNSSMKFRTAHQMENYEQIVVPLLKTLASKKISNDDLLEILRQFYYYTHPVRYKGVPQARQIRFDSLMRLYGKENKAVQILGEAAKYMLNYKYFSFPIFESLKDLQYTFKKGEILYLVCSMALNLVPPQKFQDDLKRSSRFSFGENFTFIFFKEYFKTQAIMEYLNQIFKQIAKNKEILNEKLTVRRQITRQNIKQLIKLKGKYPMQKFKVVDNKKSIEEYNGHIKVDFANQYIGGGVLHTGCVQEEIMFANRPQIMTTMLFCQVMEPNESLFFTGFKKYFKNTGYAWTLKYAGFEQQDYKMDKDNRAKQYIAAIDALRFHSQTNPEQMSKENIKRQILKAYTGFNNPQKADIITGNWGCGAFNGEVRCKFLIQWIACSLAGKRMIYCPFGSQQTILNCEQVLKRLQKMPVGQVYQRLISAGAKMKNMKQNIFEFIWNQLD